MLCSKCHGNIPQGKEIQIEGLIICKECALATEKTKKEKVIARCWNCNELIHKGDLIYESSRNDFKNFSKWFSIGTKSSGKLFQCDECYQEWRKDVKKLENLSWVRFLLLGVCVGYSLNLILDLFFLEIAKKLDDNKSSTITLYVLLFIIFFIILGPFLEINRYKLRKKRKKQESKK